MGNLNNRDAGSLEKFTRGTKLHSIRTAKYEKKTNRIPERCNLTLLIDRLLFMAYLFHDNDYTTMAAFMNKASSWFFVHVSPSADIIRELELTC